MTFHAAACSRKLYVFYVMLYSAFTNGTSGHEIINNSEANVNASMKYNSAPAVKLV
jgi:hypothetical protein